MTTVTRRFEFDAAHRVLGHEGKCRHLHGHRYAALVTARAEALDNLGRVVDFGVLKSLLGTWIDAHLDHNILLHPDDPLACLWRQLSCGDRGDLLPVFGGRKPYFMTARGNPTAENIAQLLYDVASDLLGEAGTGLQVVRVRVYETPNCYADYQPEG